MNRTAWRAGPSGLGIRASVKQRIVKHPSRRLSPCAAQPSPGPQTLPELAKHLPALDQVTSNQAYDIGTFWNSAVTSLPFLKGRPELAKLAIPDWVAGHPAALLTVRLFGSVLVSFVAVKILDWLSSVAAAKVRSCQKKKCIRKC